jgi:hypothetical protein
MHTMQIKNHIIMKKAVMLFSFITFLSVSTFASEYDKWGQHNPEEATVIDHSPMSSILKFLTVEDDAKSSMLYYLSKGKALNYITSYRKYLESLPVSLLNKDEQLAYWLNLHNIVVIEMLSSSNKLTKKIKKLRGQPGKPGKVWAEKRVQVEQNQLSLEEIEQKILLQHWQNPLVLYGVFYSTKGSPLLGLEAFSGPNVYEQLAVIAGKFINNKNNVKISKDKVKLSSLYIWNKKQLFANDDKAIIAHLQKYAKGRSVSKLQSVTQVDDSHKFNWSSNAQRRPRSVSGFSNAGGGGFGGGGRGS